MKIKFGWSFLALALMMVFQTPVALAGETEIGGRYRGITVDTDPESNLPERLSINLILAEGEGGTFQLGGGVRFYLDEYPKEYLDLKLESAQINLVTNRVTLKTKENGLTFKLRLISSEGILKGEIYSDSLGKIAEVVVAKFSTK